MLALVGSPAPPPSPSAQVARVVVEEEEEEEIDESEQDEEEEEEDDFAQPKARRRQPPRNSKAQKKPLKKTKKARQPAAKAPLPEDAFEVFHPMNFCVGYLPWFCLFQYAMRYVFDVLWGGAMRWPLLVRFGPSPL